MVHFSDIELAAERIAPFSHRTPVLTSRQLNAKFGSEFFIKAESFQRSGSFKFRGAMNAMLQLSEEQRRSGVLTYSSGNHAQALALAGSLLGAPVLVVMPNDAPAVKRAATEGYGGEVILYDRDETTREVLGTKLAEERGLTLVPPYDHPHIIAGAGTAVRELILEAGELDMLLVCLGGGGLLSGSAVSAKAMAPQCQVIGVEPEAGDDIARSFRSGQIETVKDPITIADGARTPSASALTFAHIQAHVDDVVTVTDATLVECTKFYAERMKLLIEPTGCLSLAAAWEGKVDVSGKRVGVVVSGGNVDLTRLASLWTGGTGLD